MIEQGTVISIKDEFATVHMEKGAECENCHVCDSFGTEYRTLEAINHPNAQIGNRVEVEIKSSKVLLYSFLIFIFPIILMIIGYFAASNAAGQAGAKEGIGAVGSIAGLVIAFILIKVFANKVKGDKKTIAHVNRIIIAE